MDEVWLDNDWEFDILVESRNAQTRKLEKTTGLTGIQGWFSLTAGGVAIAGTVANLTEASAVQAPGRYVGPLDAAALTAALLPSLETTVHEVIERAGDFKVSRALMVRRPRPPL